MEKRRFDAANAAWPAWVDLIVEHQVDLALILTTEQGKLLAEAKGEIR